MYHIFINRYIYHIYHDVFIYFINGIWWEKNNKYLTQIWFGGCNKWLIKVENKMVGFSF